jgi:hypothetical protein
VDIIMIKGDFLKLFLRVLNDAAEDAETKLLKAIPRSFLIRLHSFGLDSRLLSVDEAADKIYISPDRFYRIIDVAIEEVLPTESVAFVRVSGHPSDALSATWNRTGSGPFKQIVFDKIVDRRAQSG